MTPGFVVVKCWECHLEWRGISWRFNENRLQIEKVHRDREILKDKGKS